MKNLKFLFLGMLFGIVLIKAEVISWFRIQEMFRFQSFHMFGIIGSAVVIGAISILIIRKFNIKSINGEKIDPKPKPFNKVGNITGGFIFGLGWALVGACPGPLYALLGSGYSIIALPIVGAIIGVITYGALKNKLPH
ncbi:MAG: YeeE/YedE thiosulfate transporter family protein [Vicingaceae bacterium]|nr:YeeE/YedE thiosulfate transporter family protein [Vicingaceae bacterium]